MSGPKTVNNPRLAFPDALDSYADTYPSDYAELQANATITGNAPVIAIPNATTPTGKVTPATTTSSALLFMGIVQNNSTTAAAGDTVRVVKTGIAQRVVSTGTIAAGDAVGFSKASNGAVAACNSNDATCIGFALNDASGNVVDIFVLGPGPTLTGNAPNGGFLTFTIDLADIADGDMITNFVPGFSGTIIGFHAVVLKAATTAAKASTLNLEIGATNLTGGSLALTSANMTPKGAVVSATAITGGNVFGSTDSISVEASSTTTFIEGRISLVIVYQ